MKQPPTFARDRKLASVGGRPQINADVRELVRRMVTERLKRNDMDFLAWPADTAD
jgi:hypothetical protein